LTHLKSDLPISTAVLANPGNTMQMHTACRVTPAFLFRLRESRFSDPFPTENHNSEKVGASNSLSNSSESGSIHHLFRKFFRYSSSATKFEEEG